MLPENFNWRQYVTINRDLKLLKQEDAIHHYLNHGIKEGRIYNLNNIPEDFDHISYLKCNSDLALLKLNKSQCKIHYLQFGIKENRKYKIEKPEKNITNQHTIKDIDSSTREFKILGERCSGTNHLEEEIVHNFKNIRFRDQDFHKHFFCLYDFEYNKNITDNVIYIGIVRNAIDWIYSFFNAPHNVDKDIIHNIYDFITKEFSSYNFVNNNYVLIHNDVHYITGKKYCNIFECRKIKNDFLLHIIPKSVKNYILIRYEDLRDNLENTLDTIKKTFNLEKKKHTYEALTYYKKNKNKEYSRKYNTFDDSIKKYIIDNLDLEMEKKLGYDYTEVVLL